MKNLFLITVIVLLFSCTDKKANIVLTTQGDVTTEEFITSYNNAFESLNSADYEEYLANAKKVYAFAPHDVIVQILYADALVSMNKEQEAIQILQSLKDQHSHLTYDRVVQDHFQFIKNLDVYNELLSSFASDTLPINNSTIAYKLDEKDLIPEGVAYDTKTKTLFISSIYKRKIVSIDQNGNIQDFVKTGDHNLLAVAGMEVDVKRRHLWACSIWDNPRKILPDSLLHTSIYKYDVDNGNLLKKYTLIDTIPRLLNDVTIAKDGTVYITESNMSKMYIIRPEADSLELLINSDHAYYANGITISDNNKNLYFTHFFGDTYVLNLETNAIQKLKHPGNMHTGRVDGLAFYKNSLIMHQGEIARYYLNEAGDSITNMEIMERNNPLFEIPTTGEVADDEYFYIANAQLGKTDNEGFILPDDQLDTVYILKTKL